MEIPKLDDLESELANDPAYAALGTNLGDRRDGRIYVHDERIRTAVRVAIATGRPLLLRGDPGSGKSSLAPFIARALGWRFYSVTVTARTQARDLMWEFDALRRLSDAQVFRPAEGAPSVVDKLEYYVEPKALWWALDASSAARRGLPPEQPFDPKRRPVDPGIGGNASMPPAHGAGTVVLIDEIDKADPDVPNNLLECLGSLQFTVQETGFSVRIEREVRERRRHPPLVLITTNDERELPAAFQRRCATLFLKSHQKPELVEIARKQFAGLAGAAGANLGSAQAEKIYAFVADELARLKKEAATRAQREPSTAEYLDAVKACLEICNDPANDAKLWQQIAGLTLGKQNPFTEPGASSSASAAG